MENTTSETERAYNKEKTTKLVLAVAFDLVGMLTFIVPGVGEFADLVWAPVAGIANFLMFRGFAGVAGGTGTLVEELLPGFDWIPSFTITWGIKYIVQENKTLAEFAKRHKERKAILAE